MHWKRQQLTIATKKNLCDSTLSASVEVGFFQERWEECFLVRGWELLLPHSRSRSNYLFLGGSDCFQIRCSLKFQRWWKINAPFETQIHGNQKQTAYTGRFCECYVCLINKLINQSINQFSISISAQNSEANENSSLPVIINNSSGQCVNFARTITF